MQGWHGNLNIVPGLAWKPNAGSEWTILLAKEMVTDYKQSLNMTGMVDPLLVLKAQATGAVPCRLQALYHVCQQSIPKKKCVIHH